ncbi:hypothetical protein [Mesorhizobium sp. M0909]|uniref:hypothetical protein n=1 Tax=Mesorhizobium sp. M0909 TaxID=2957024 RepID=UPI00333C2D63
MKPFEQRGNAIIRRLPPDAKVVEVGVLIGALSEYLLRRRGDIKLYRSTTDGRRIGSRTTIASPET